MRKVYSSSRDFLLVECINQYADKWVVRFDIIDEEEEGVSYMEEEFLGTPSPEAIKELLINYINMRVQREIVEGMVWKGHKIWLSQENQNNYKSAFDLAVHTGGSNLPYRIKAEGVDSEYYTFDTVDDITDFIVSVNSHISSVIEAGWKAKDSVDWDQYTVRNDA